MTTITILPNPGPIEGGSSNWPSDGPHKGIIIKAEIGSNKKGDGENLRITATADDEEGTAAILTCPLPNGGGNDEFFTQKLGGLLVSTGEIDTDTAAEGLDFDTDDLIGKPVYYRVKSAPSTRTEGATFRSADTIFAATYAEEMESAGTPANGGASNGGAKKGAFGKPAGKPAAGKPAAKPNPFGRKDASA